MVAASTGEHIEADDTRFEHDLDLTDTKVR
jgi:hypothetical protein